MKRKRLTLSLRTKIIGSFMSVLLLLSAVSWISINQFEKVDSSYSNLLKRRTLVIENVQKLKTEVIEQQNSVRGLLLTGEAEYLNHYQESQKEIQEAMEQFAVTAPNESAKKMIQELDDTYEQYKVQMDALVSLAVSNREEAVRKFASGHMHELGDSFLEQADKIIETANGVMAEDQAATQKTTSAIVNWLIISISIAILLGLIISLGISHSIARAVGKVSDALKQLASGNFSIEPINIKRNDEIGEMGRALNQMIHDLRNILRQVSESSEYITASMHELSSSAEQSNHAAAQVAEIAQKNASGTEKQMAACQETAKRIDKIRNEVEAIAQTGEDMRKASAAAVEIAQKGGARVDVVVNQMLEISQSTADTASMVKELHEHAQNINGIISLITDISDQTNLLALNAAIEAARAGEQGKGFAVVAEEVRKLAEESHQSAEKVVAMVETIRQKINMVTEAIEKNNQLVETGLSHTYQAKDSFAELESSIETVGRRVSEVTASVAEIASFSREIVQEIERLQSISEQSLQLSQESSAATEEQLAAMEEIASSVQNVAAMTEELQKEISRFRI